MFRSMLVCCGVIGCDRSIMLLYVDCHDFLACIYVYTRKAANLRTTSVCDVYAWCSLLYLSHSN